MRLGSLNIAALSPHLCFPVAAASPAEEAGELFATLSDDQQIHLITALLVVVAGC